MTRPRVIKRLRRSRPRRDGEERASAGGGGTSASLGGPVGMTVVMIEKERCRAILASLASAAAAERPVVLSEAFMLGAVRDAMCRTVTALVAEGSADLGRILGTL